MKNPKSVMWVSPRTKEQRAAVRQAAAASKSLDVKAKQEPSKPQRDGFADVAAIEEALEKLPSGCRWPMPDGTFCNKPQTHKSYCGEHYEMATTQKVSWEYHITGGTKIFQN